MGEIKIKVDSVNRVYDVSSEDFDGNQVVAYLFTVVIGMIENGTLTKQDVIKMLKLDQ